jgi:predicted alpha/beta hydrolase
MVVPRDGRSAAAQSADGDETHCFAMLTRAHARSGERIAISSYLGRGNSFDRAIADFSVSYADQNERDDEALVAAVSSGRLKAETGL